MSPEQAEIYWLGSDLPAFTAFKAQLPYSLSGQDPISRQLQKAWLDTMAKCGSKTFLEVIRRQQRLSAFFDIDGFMQLVEAHAELASNARHRLIPAFLDQQERCVRLAFLTSRRTAANQQIANSVLSEARRQAEEAAPRHLGDQVALEDAIARHSARVLAGRFPRSESRLPPENIERLRANK